MFTLEDRKNHQLCEYTSNFLHGYGCVKKKRCILAQRKWNNSWTTLSAWGEYFQDLHFTQSSPVKTKPYFFSCLIVLNSTLHFFHSPPVKWGLCGTFICSWLPVNDKCLSKMAAKDIKHHRFYTVPTEADKLTVCFTSVTSFFNSAPSHCFWHAFAL